MKGRNPKISTHYRLLYTIQINGQLVRDEANIIELVKYFRTLMLPVFVGLLLSMIGAILLIFAMRWISAIIAWGVIALFHILLLARKYG